MVLRPAQGCGTPDPAAAFARSRTRHGSEGCERVQRPDPRHRATMPDRPPFVRFSGRAWGLASIRPILPEFSRTPDTDVLPRPRLWQNDADSYRRYPAGIGLAATTGFDQIQDRIADAPSSAWQDGLEAWSCKK